MPKKSYDRFDAEAEREGSAIKSSRESRVSRPMGKRIMKIRRQHESGHQKIQTKMEKRYVR